MALLFDNTGPGNLTLKSPASGAYTLEFPLTAGISGQFLKTDGAGGLSWDTTPSTLPGGINTEIQFNDSGAFGSDSTLTYNKATTTLTTTNLVLNGNFTFGATSQRIIGDFSNATPNNRLLFQTSTTNGQTDVGIMPNGTATVSSVSIYNGSDPNNANVGRFVANGTTDVRIVADKTGTGSYASLAFVTNNAEQVRINTSGQLLVGSGSSISPSLAFKDEFNTGFYRPGAGSVVFQVGGAETIRADSTRNVVLGSESLTTTSTDGFVYLASTPGLPTGVPSSFPGHSAITYNTSNDKLYVYNSGWKDINGVNVGGDTITGDLVINGNLQVDTRTILGNQGTEGSGINVGGVTYESTLKVSDISGTNLAQTILHRHSTTLEPVIVGARSNSNDSSHVDVVAGQNTLSLYGAGWAGSNYKIFGGINISTNDTGTISDTSAPGKIEFLTTPDGSTSPQLALSLRSNKSAVFLGNALFPAGTVGAPSISFSSDTDTGIYSSGANAIGFTVGGSAVCSISSTYISSAAAFLAPAGSPSAPGFLFQGDAGTGLYSSAANNITFTTNSTARMQLNNSGLCIGDYLSASLPLEVWKTSDTTLARFARGSGTNNPRLEIGVTDATKLVSIDATGSTSSTLQIMNGGTAYHHFRNDGRVGINSTGDNNYTCTVNSFSNSSAHTVFNVANVGWGANLFSIAGDGQMISFPTYNTFTTTNAANVYVNSSGGFFRSTSSIKYKTQVEDLDPSYADKLLDFRPVWYRSTCEADRKDWSWYGFIAEDMAAIEPRFVDYKQNEDGTLEPEGVQYSRIVVPLVALVQKQQQQINTQQQQINGLMARVAALEQR